MKQTLLFMILFGASMMAQAVGGDFGVGNGGDGLVLSYPNTQPTAPAPVAPPVGAVSYEALKLTWDQGMNLNEQSLTGTWKMVAYTTSENCNWGVAEGYDANGLAMPDGNVMKLDFKRTLTPKNDFTGALASNLFTVTLLNVGEKNQNQGPYKVDAWQPQFAQWSYKNGETPELRKDSYYEYSCRAVRGSSTKMICAIKLRLLQPEAVSAKTLACARNEFSGMYGFSK